MLLDIPTVEKIQFIEGTSKIKMDDFNNRIKIVSYSGLAENLIDKILDLAKEKDVGKIFYIGSKDEVNKFKDLGFIMEAKANNFLNGESGYFLSKFLLPERKMCLHIPEEEEVLIEAREYINNNYKVHTYNNYFIRDGHKEDVKQLATLYDSVFETYPSPMNDPDYILYAMNNNVVFKVALQNDKIVSAASADIDPTNFNAEMTDCATYISHRGHGLMSRLIYELEKDLKNKNFKSLYSMARSISIGMNIVFAKHNYQYGGKLINHAHICGQFENMNIWVKELN
ncbi:MAG: putative beta-lysine N-acetyltransferase [Eubacteriales bacterium]